MFEIDTRSLKLPYIISKINVTTVETCQTCGEPCSNFYSYVDIYITFVFCSFRKGSPIIYILTK